MYRNFGFNLVQERGLILAMEMLATDFAGWGTLFPLSKRMATDWLETVAFGMEGRLLDTYMPLALGPSSLTTSGHRKDQWMRERLGALKLNGVGDIVFQKAQPRGRRRAHGDAPTPKFPI